ncbi:MAG TPA: hypothetical protein VLN49_02940 [Gemmatimonadaceae bacterium]|nr:hypothetical protein [Gemmatimonadaceae bacterium]
MRRVSIALTSLCLMSVPMVAGAQRIGGFGRGRLPGHLEREPGIVVPKVVNPVNLLVEHRQQLALSDTQFAQVIAIKRVLDSTNAPLARKLDSVQRLFKGGPVFSEPNADRRDSLAQARGLVQDMTGAIDDNNNAARDKAYALLSVQQLATARDLEAKAEQAIEEETKRGKARGNPTGGTLGRPPSR